MGDEPEITISTNNPDREGDRVLAAGADTSNFFASPTLTWAHSRDEIPIGTITHLEIGPKSRIRWRWLKGDPFADRVRNAWEQGIVRAASIEFLPKPGGKQANAYGGYDYDSWELLGVSLVPLPANAEAVRAFKNLGLWPKKASKTGLAVDLAAYQKWFDRSPTPGGMKEGERRTPVERDFAEMDAKHAVIRAAEDAWDHVAPRGEMGVAIRRPDFKSLAADHIPRECRGGAGQTPQEQLQGFRARLRSQGLVPASGPLRSHGPNLGPSPEIEFDASDVKAALRDLTPKIARMVREAVGKAQPIIDRAITRARGRID